MQGRIANIKKSKILKASAIINFLFALFFLLFTFFYFKRYDFWFFIVCFYFGVYLLSKGGLFISDSSVYFGSILFFIGISGCLVHIFNITISIPFYLFSFAIASIITLLFFREIYHIYLALLFVVEGLLVYLFQAKIINLVLFLLLNAILFFIFLIYCVIIFRKIKNRS